MNDTAAAAESGASFVPDQRWSVAGALTVDSAADVLVASEDAPLPETGVVSLSGLRAVDSAAVAVMLSWRRRSTAEGRKLVFADVPPNLVALAELYGVEDLLDS
ncbi:MAG TPA: STAS domain-containing protein [Casimicrobiaceae bacterium]|nr:STAS domain-containing protein [Casimicrobiaceae bacterium]